MKFRMKKMVDGYTPGDHAIREPGKEDIIVKAGQEVDCDPKLLENVMHKFDIVDPFENERPQGSTLLVVRRHNTPNYFDVVNIDTGKAINTKALSKAKAEELAGRKFIEPMDKSGETEDPPAEDPSAGNES
jgi:hypothetical protein